VSHRVVLVVWLTAVWVLLWEGLTPANVLGGLAVAVGLVLLFPPRHRGGRRVRPLALLRLAGHFAVKLVQANVVLAWEVVTPRNRINEGIVAVPLDEEEDGILTLVANAVSLTPGTLTIEVRRAPTVLYVHVLHLHSREAARAEVRTLHRLTVAAFPPREAR